MALNAVLVPAVVGHAVADRELRRGCVSLIVSGYSQLQRHTNQQKEEAQHRQIRRSLMTCVISAWLRGGRWSIAARARAESTSPRPNLHLRVRAETGRYASAMQMRDHLSLRDSRRVWSTSYTLEL